MLIYQQLSVCGLYRQDLSGLEQENQRAHRKISFHDCSLDCVVLPNRENKLETICDSDKIFVFLVLLTLP